jgi:hypothetical protein
VSARKVPIAVRLTPEQEAAYSLDYGVAKTDLKPEVQAEYDRLLAERRASGQAPANLPEPISAQSLNQLWWQFVRRAMHTKTFWILSALWAIIFASFIAYGVVSPDENFQALRNDLASVHLPAGYRLIAQHRAGTDCHDQCSITLTYEWARSSRRTTSAACADALHALTSAYSGTSANSPIPAHAACDYYADVPGNPFNPGEGKPVVEAIVQPSQTPAQSSFEIELTAYYYTVS